MASTKKQDKTSTVPEQALPAPADQVSDSKPGGSDINGADADAGGVATSLPSADLSANVAQEAGGPAIELPVGPGAVTTSTKDAAGATAHVAGPDELASSAPVEVNPAQVNVYPLRSFMDEGELRRRGGPSYLVPRRHAEELELRKLVSRTPLED